MDYSKIIADESFFEWHGYAPMDAQYVKYFESFFNSLIAEIMPKDYKESKVPLIDYLNTLLKMNHCLDINEA